MGEPFDLYYHPVGVGWESPGGYCSGLDVLAVVEKRTTGKPNCRILPDFMATTTFMLLCLKEEGRDHSTNCRPNYATFDTGD